MYANPLGRSLNKQPMHKLVQIILLGHVLISCVFGAFGLITYAPPQILASAAVIMAVSIAANAGLSRLYSVRSDSQSALITGLILSLVLTPGLDPLRLTTLALVAIIAQASKYVIAIKGRHIFNPAAIGLVIASLGGLSYASWWIASPPMALITAFAAFIMLYKLRLLRVGGLFIAVSASIIIVRTIATGTLPGDAFVLAFTSWPILFIAAFMLTEPTTLPPRRWQKLLVAGIVGLVFALPFTIGPFSSTPAVALIVGNFVAYLYGQHRAIILRFKSMRALTPTSRELIFNVASPLRFIPGQYLDLFIPHAKADFKSSRRSFSLTSIPGTNEVSLGIRFTEPVGSFKQRLLELAEGDTLTASNISGDFVLPNNTTKILFIAGGIGITPFISQIRAMKAAGESRDIILLYFTRSSEETAYKDELRAVQSHIITNSKRLTQKLLTERVPDISTRQVYISGPPDMVDASKRIVKQAGARSIKTDYFSGY